MTDQLQAMQQQIVAAVQQQLTQYSQQVSSEVQRLRDEIAAERVARSQIDDQLRSLATGLEQSTQTNGSFQGDLQRALEERLTEFSASTKRRHDEMNERLGKVVDESNVGMSSAVESAVRPLLRDLEHRQDKVQAEVDTLDKSLRKFDDQAARMVTHINDVTTSVETRIEQVSTGIVGEVESRIASVASRVDEMSAQAARQQSEVSNVVGARVDEAEQRINDRIVSAEARIGEEVGSRVADIDAYVGRVSVGLDEGLVMLNDRIAEIHTRFEDVNGQIAAMEQNLKDVDADAIEEMKEKVSGAAGEAMLVRIDMERFQGTVDETLTKTAVRLTELETQLQDQAMDTETAVQLERLEEVERAIIALDPAQFVRADGAASPAARPAAQPTAQPTVEHMTQPVVQPAAEEAAQKAVQAAVEAAQAAPAVDETAFTMAPPLAPLTLPDADPQ